MIFGAAILVCAAGCSSSSATSGAATAGATATGGNTSGATTGSTVGCDTVCAHIAAVCGQAGQCANVCPGWDSATRSCASAAGTCAQVNGCGSSSSSTSSTGSSTTTGSSTSTTGTSGTTITCDPFSRFTSAPHTYCAQGCDTEQAEDQSALWCLKPCSVDADCGTGNVACQPENTPGFPRVCVPICFNDSQCASLGSSGRCNTLYTPGYCSNGPFWVHH